MYYCIWWRVSVRCFNFISISVTFSRLFVSNCCFLFLALKMTTRMTTPTTMTTSTITTATTMISDVVVSPSLGGLLVGCVLLLTKTVPVIVPTVWGGEVAPTVWGGEVVPVVCGGEVVPTVGKE